MSGTLRILGPSGDVALTWEDVTDDKFTEAKTKFGELMEKGFSAFEMGKDKKGKQVKSFNPDADTVLVPRLVGG